VAISKKLLWLEVRRECKVDTIYVIHNSYEYKKRANPKPPFLMDAIQVKSWLLMISAAFYCVKQIFFLFIVIHLFCFFNSIF